MVRAGDFKNGVTVEYKGNACQIVEFQHVKPGKGSPFVRAKLKNVKTGNVVEDTFSPDDKLPKAIIEKSELSYSYSDDDNFYFMDTTTWEEVQLPRADVADAMKFVKDNTTVTAFSYQGKIFNVEPENFVELQIIDTEPGFKGNTATNTFKPATVETGAQIKVPLFIDIDEVVRIDTRTGEYMGRA